MTAEQAERIARTARYVRAEMRGDSSGHDWWHVDRVRALAVRLAGREHADLSEFLAEWDGTDIPAS